MAKRASVPSSEVSLWLANVKSAERERKSADSRYGYTESLKQYRGDFSVLPTFVSNVDLIPINEVYSYAKAFVPSVYARDPFIAVNPRGAKHVASAKLLELALAAYWRDLRLKREMRRAIWDAIFAEGWIKVGFTGAFGEKEGPADKPAVDPSEFVKHEEIFAKRVSWQNMVRDGNAVNGIHDARWVAQQILLPLEAVRASSLYENKKNIVPQFTEDLGNGVEREYACLWEIWDRDTYKVYCLAEGSPDWLWSPKEWPYDMEGFPFGLLRFNENPDEAYAPNLIKPWVAQLWEKMKIRAMQMDHLKRFNRQMQAKKGALTPGEMQKFTKGLTGSVIENTDGIGLQTIPYPPFQQDAYPIEGRIDLDKDNISGQPNAVRSAPQKTQSRTLGEIDRLLTSFQARQVDPQNLVEEFSEDVGYKLIAVIKQHLPGEKFVRATQREAQEVQAAFGDSFDGVGFTFSRSDIQDAEFELDLKSGSTLPADRQGRLEAMVNILKLGPTIGIQPGGEVALTAGKNIIGEFDMLEIQLAYEKELAKLAAAQKVMVIGKHIALSETQRKAQEMRRRMSSEMSEANGDV